MDDSNPLGTSEAPRVIAGFWRRVFGVFIVGEPLELVKSFLRYTILGVPFFLNNSHLPPQLLASWIGTLFSVLVFGFGGSIIYLIIFNRRTRQSLHDLIVGSYVVKSGVPKSEVAIKM